MTIAPCVCFLAVQTFAGKPCKRRCKTHIKVIYVLRNDKHHTSRKQAFPWRLKNLAKSRQNRTVIAGQECVANFPSHVRPSCRLLGAELEECLSA